MKSPALALLALLTLTGCVNQPTPLQRPAFPVDEYRALTVDGNSTITGQVFMKTVGGDVKFGAGSDVLLFPVTSYSKFWYTNNYLGQRPLTPADERLKEYTQITQADGNGNFKFKNVAPGDYFLSSIVSWQAPTQYGLSLQGGNVVKRVHLEEDGVEINVILTK